MDFSLNELRAFCATAECTTMSDAARNLGLTQPALSWSIKKMEDALGVPLFHRSKKGVTLTKPGETLFLRSREMIRSWEDLREVMKSDGKDLRGIYSLGVHGTIATYILPMFYPSLLIQNPDVELRLVHDLSRNIAEGVIRFKTDFGIVVDPPKHPDLIIIPLYRDEFKFWIGSNPSPLADCGSSSGLVACNPHLLRTATLMREGVRSGLIKGARVVHTTELELIANLTAHGSAVGVLPATIAVGRPGPPLHPLEGTPIFRDEVCLIYRHDTLSKGGLMIKDHIVASLKGKHPMGISSDTFEVGGV